MCWALGRLAAPSFTSPPAARLVFTRSRPLPVTTETQLSPVAAMPGMRSGRGSRLRIEMWESFWRKRESTTPSRTKLNKSENFCKAFYLYVFESLLLQDSSGLKLWKRRWFVLSNYCLYYYKGRRQSACSSRKPCWEASRCQATKSCSARRENARTGSSPSR
uniref:PH domain-containing protein n=1 Tax=Xiphophorus couchianus TaxID=32473 RepID=A0A3B5KXQ6_9TELE